MKFCSKITLCLVALAITASAAFARHIIIIIGPATPEAKNHPGMKVTFPNGPMVVAGEDLKAVAGKFKRGEYVAIWRYKLADGSSSQLNGGFASSNGKINIFVSTLAGITKPGKYTVCAQGQKNARKLHKPVACGRFTVTEADVGGGDSGGGSDDSGTSSGPTTGPGYVPPGSS